MAVNLMHQYILEEKDILKNIILNRKNVSKNGVDILRDPQVEQIYIIGSGTSYHAAIAAKEVLGFTTGKQILTMYPTHFVLENIPSPKSTVVIGISQGGKSLSTINGLKKAQKLGIKTIGMTEYENSDLARLADQYIPISVGSRENAGAKTKGYVATVLTLMVLGTETGQHRKIIDNRTYQQLIDRIEASVENINRIITSSERWFGDIGNDFLEAKEIMVVGYGTNYATAMEGALKLLETVRCPVIGYEMEEYMHGVYNCINADSYLIFLAANHKDKERILQLRNFLGNITNHCYVIGKNSTFNHSKRDLALSIEDDPFFSVFEYIVPLQVLASLLSNKKGVDPAVPKFPDFHQKMKSKV
ncbi:SIS domain-containing protein [Alteribacillus sp. YIM 98480]|uniref:SIS domain-containing protein n=1 Tax=Alteribacillus sp. YIM 98480 TaxID=2606599 RepID=UPI00131C7C96|nr:SIS domain-containing protein [Alteribacillus sp. YIM 98480]